MAGNKLQYQYGIPLGLIPLLAQIEAYSGQDGSHCDDRSATRNANLPVGARASHRRLAV